MDLVRIRSEEDLRRLINAARTAENERRSVPPDSGGVENGGSWAAAAEVKVTGAKYTPSDPLPEGATHAIVDLYPGVFVYRNPDFESPTEEWYNGEECYVKGLNDEPLDVGVRYRVLINGERNGIALTTAVAPGSVSVSITGTSGFFARLTTSGTFATGSGTRSGWNFFKKRLNHVTGTWGDDGVEITDYKAIPARTEQSTTPSRFTDVPYSGMWVWMIESKQTGLFEFTPLERRYLRGTVTNVDVSLWPEVRYEVDIDTDLQTVTLYCESAMPEIGPDASEPALAIGDVVVVWSKGPIDSSLTARNFWALLVQYAGAAKGGQLTKYYQKIDGRKEGLRDWWFDKSVRVNKERNNFEALFASISDATYPIKGSAFAVEVSETASAYPGFYVVPRNEAGTSEGYASFGMAGGGLTGASGIQSLSVRGGVTGAQMMRVAVCGPLSHLNDRYVYGDPQGGSSTGTLMWEYFRSYVTAGGGCGTTWTSNYLNTWSFGIITGTPVGRMSLIDDIYGIGLDLYDGTLYDPAIYSAPGAADVNVSPFTAAAYRIYGRKGVYGHVGFGAAVNGGIVTKLGTAAVVTNVCPILTDGVLTGITVEYTSADGTKWCVDNPTGCCGGPSG